MLGAIKSISEAVTSWHENRSLLYSLVAGACAALVVASWDSGRRPSDVLAWIARGIGATPVADWFGPEAPPILEAQNPSVQKAALWAVLLLLAVMVLAPFYRDVRRSGWAVAPRSLLLVGSPAASTVWLLLMLAAQQGDIAPVIRFWAQIGGALGACVVVILFIAASVARYRERRGFGERATALLMQAVGLGARILFCVGMAIFAILFTAVSAVVMIVQWMCALQSDDSREFSEEIERRRDGRRGQPTGADVVPLSTGESS